VLSACSIAAILKKKIEKSLYLSKEDKSLVKFGTMTHFDLHKPTDDQNFEFLNIQHGQLSPFESRKIATYR